MRVEGRDSDEWMAVKLGQRKQYTISLSGAVCVYFMLHIPTSLCCSSKPLQFQL